ncbi:MAG: NYN domain-containing protein [Chloroflexota bacterium]|nr:NYN domain-containing protein [Chloroflexota bacterium]
MRANVYIDGFNLYNRAVKGTAYKWLDLSKLCQALLLGHEIHRIRYFTALVHARPNDPQRQQVYLRALRTIPNLTIEYGQFRARIKERPLVAPIPGESRNVLVHDTEEKGIDVNLATYLLIDGYERDYEQALVISNDADLALPVSMVRDKLRLPVGIVNPNTDPREGMPKELRDAATFDRRIYRSTLRKCQFPSTLRDATGTITRPGTW